MTIIPDYFYADFSKVCEVDSTIDCMPTGEPSNCPDINCIVKKGTGVKVEDAIKHKNKIVSEVVIKCVSCKNDIIGKPHYDRNDLLAYQPYHETCLEDKNKLDKILYRLEDHKDKIADSKIFMAEKLIVSDSYLEEITLEIRNILDKSEFKHPFWPYDIIHGTAVMGEEAGEAIKAAYEVVYENRKIEDLKMELLHTIATSIRMFYSLEKRGL